MYYGCIIDVLLMYYCCIIVVLLMYMNDKQPEKVIMILEPVSDTFNKIFSIQYLLGLANEI